MSNNVINTTTNATTFKSFNKGMNAVKGIIFPKDKGLAWRLRLQAILTLIEGAGEQKLKGITAALLGQSFCLIQFRDERDQEAIAEALPQEDQLDIEKNIKLYFLKDLWEAGGALKKLLVVEAAADCGVITEKQAEILNNRYEFRFERENQRKIENQVADQLRQLTSTPKGRNGYRGNQKAEPIRPVVLAERLYNSLPGVRVEAVQAAVRAIARGNQAKTLPQKAKRLVEFWDAAEQRRQESLAKLSA